MASPRSESDLPSAVRRAPRAPPKKRSHARRTKKERIASTLYNVTLDVNDLRQQIQQLALQRALLISRPRALAASLVSPDGSSFLKVERLFRVFNHGYRVRDDVPQAYIEMLTGGAALFQYWAQHAEVFASTRCEIRSLRVVPTERGMDEDEKDDLTRPVCEVRVEGLSHGAFTIGALHRFWPAVLHDPQLTQTLLGRQMAKPMSFSFAFNSAGRVVWYTIEPDFHAALTHALDGDAMRATAIMNGEVDATRVETCSPLQRGVEDEEDFTSCGSSDAEVVTRPRFEEEEDDAVDDGCEDKWNERPTTGARHSIAYLLS